MTAQHFRNATLVAWAACALLVRAAPAHGETDRSDRVLILMAGQGHKAGDIEPLLDRVCTQSADGALARRYSHVVKVGVNVDLDQVLRGLAPGEAKAASTEFVNQVVTALKNEALTPCTHPPPSDIQLKTLPFDALVITVLRDEVTSVNLKLNLVESDRSIEHTRRTVDRDAMRVALSSVDEIGPFVGCMAWTVWSTSRWLSSDVACDLRWGLRARPHDWRPWALRSAIASGMVAGIATTLWVITDRNYSSYTSECSMAVPCLPSKADRYKSTIGTLETAWKTGAVVAVGLAATSSLFYILSHRGQEARPLPAVQVTLGLPGAPGLGAVGRW